MKDIIIVPTNIKVDYIQRSYKVDEDGGITNFYSLTCDINEYGATIVIEEELDESMRVVDIKNYIEFNNNNIIIDDDAIDCVDEVIMNVFKNHSNWFYEDNENVKDIEESFNKGLRECFKDLEPEDLSA